MINAHICTFRDDFDFFRGSSFIFVSSGRDRPRFLGGDGTMELFSRSSIDAPTSRASVLVSALLFCLCRLA